MRDPEIRHPHPAPPYQALPHPLATIRAGISGFPSPAEAYVGRSLQMPASQIGSRSSRHRKCGCFLPFTGSHSYQPSAGTRQR